MFINIGPDLSKTIPDSSKPRGSNYRFALRKLCSGFNYCHCEGVNRTKKKNAKQLFSQGTFNSSLLYFSPLNPHYIHILFILCILLSKELVLIPNITLQNGKDAHSMHWGIKPPEKQIPLSFVKHPLKSENCPSPVFR